MLIKVKIKILYALVIVLFLNILIPKVIYPVLLDPPVAAMEPLLSRLVII